MDERVATALHLDWVASLVDVAGQLYARAALAKNECSRVTGNPPP